MKKVVEELIDKLKDKGLPESQPAIEEDLQRAEKTGFPHELLEFYRLCEPNGAIEIKVRLWSIDNTLVENKDYVPGCALYPHGFIVFASTLTGDAYCIDMNVTTPEGKHPIVLFSHEIIDEETEHEKINSLRVEVAASLEDFLVKFTNETLSEEPSYG